MVDKINPIGIVFFDGNCNFCNNSVNFIYKKNKLKNLRYSSLQSEFSKQVLPQSVYQFKDFNTMYYYENMNLYSKSSAFLKLSKHLYFPYNMFSYFLIIPKKLRDSIYSFISKRRHKFIKQKTCRLMTAEETTFFLNSLDEVENYKHIFYNK